MSGDDGVLDQARIDERLAGDLPRWSREGDAIARRYRTGGWKATMLVVATIGHLAEAA